MRSENFLFGKVQFIWAIGAWCYLNRLPFHPHQQFPDPHDLAVFQRATQAIGLKAGFKQSIAQSPQQFTLPAVAFMNAPSNVNVPAPKQPQSGFH